jgi:hypothetical protein
MLAEVRAALAHPTRWQRTSCALLAAFIVVQIFYLGAKPFAVGLFPQPWDKLAHVIVFGIIALLLAVGTGRRMPAWGIVLMVAAIGALDELHQGALPGRTADFSDFFADVIAAVGALAALRFVR